MLNNFAIHYDSNLFQQTTRALIASIRPALQTSHHNVSNYAPPFCYAHDLIQTINSIHAYKWCIDTNGMTHTCRSLSSVPSVLFRFPSISSNVSNSPTNIQNNSYCSWWISNNINNKYYTHNLIACRECRQSSRDRNMDVHNSPVVPSTPNKSTSPRRASNVRRRLQLFTPAPSTQTAPDTTPTTTPAAQPTGPIKPGSFVQTTTGTSTAPAKIGMVISVDGDQCKIMWQSSAEVSIYPLKDLKHWVPPTAAPTLTPPTTPPVTQTQSLWQHDHPTKI